VTTIEFLSYLRRCNVKVWVEGEQLRYGAPKGALTAELRSELVARKGELIAFLRESRAVQQEQARLRGDGHADLVRQLEATDALEVLLGEEDLDMAEQLLAIGWWEPAHDGHVALDRATPVVGEGRRPKSLALS